MTVSVQHRQENLEFAVRKMMERVGEQWFGGVLFDILDPELKDILPTTWASLERRWLVSKAQSTLDGHVYYQLTGGGWVDGLRLTGILQSTDLRERIIYLRAKLKDQVKGRSGDADVSIPEFCSANGISRDWLWNVVESKLLENFFPNDIVDIGWWGHNARLHVLRVPVDFGMTR